MIEGEEVVTKYRDCLVEQRSQMGDIVVNYPRDIDVSFRALETEIAKISMQIDRANKMLANRRGSST